MIIQIKSGIRIIGVFLISIPFLIFSCKSKDKKMTKEADTDSIYFDYKIVGEEGYDNLTVILKYREATKTGAAITLDALTKVMLDQEVLIPDSSVMNGTYYEIQKPIVTFSGKHQVTFLSKSGKEYKEEINFSPMMLLTDIPENIYREDLVLDFSGLEVEDYIRVLLTDTSFFNDGINRIDTVRNNQLILYKKDFDRLANGPILLEFVREFERPIKDASIAGGRVRINYTLRRTFNLQN